MNTDWLEKLLTEADREDLTTVHAHDLAAKILRIRKRRRLTRYSASSAIVMALVICFAFLPRTQPASVHAVVPAKQSVETFAELQHRADELERTISTMMQAEDINARCNRLAATPPALIELTVERSATTVLGEADHLSAAGSVTDAIQTYQQIIQYFPESNAAVMARNALQSLNAKG
jgi:hypothetical protein